LPFCYLNSERVKNEKFWIGLRTTTGWWSIFLHQSNVYHWLLVRPGHNIIGRSNGKFEVGLKFWNNFGVFLHF
jgi:hypothetical protein